MCVPYRVNFFCLCVLIVVHLFEEVSPQNNNHITVNQIFLYIYIYIYIYWSPFVFPMCFRAPPDAGLRAARRQPLGPMLGPMDPFGPHGVHGADMKELSGPILGLSRAQ